MTEDRKLFVLDAIRAGRYSCDEAGNIYGHSRRGGGRPMSNHQRPQGYVAINVHYLGAVHPVYAHVVVFMYFRGMIPKGMEINHKNGTKNDNRISNLDLVTASENVRHAHSSGLARPCKGEAHHSSKLTEKDVIDIRYLLYLGRECGFPNSKIAKIYGVNAPCIHDIAKGITWKHVK